MSARAACAWEGCDELGIYRAPKGHRAEGEYHSFCLEHVRHYNTAFNFFAGMSADEVEAQVSRSTQTDGRPSWGFGAKPGAATAPGCRAGRRSSRKAAPSASPIRSTSSPATPAHRRAARSRKRVKPLHEPDRRALETLGFQRPRHGRRDQEGLQGAW